MASSTHERILKETLSLPTAPFAEHFAEAYVETFCRGRSGVRITHDLAGNMLVHVHKGGARVARPVCLTAHLDHPGFVAQEMKPGRKLSAVWRGGVRPEYFVDSRVRFHVDGRWVKGRVQSIKTTGRGAAKRVERAVVAVAKDVPPGSIGMWDFPDPVIRSGRVYARGCDDLAGVAAMLCCIHDVCRSLRRVEAYFLFTVAEEVGFVGALAACRRKTIPTRAVVVAVETSAELPGARIGDGPILRVGDKASVFTPAATAHCRRAARRLVASGGGFQYQRKLMDGGACESTVYCQRGYDATGICLALGNYHNMNTKRGSIGPEYVSVDDFRNLVAWFVELCRPSNAYAATDAALRDRLNKLEREQASLLWKHSRRAGKKP